MLRPQDCLIERIKVNPCRGRRFNYNLTPTYVSNSNPRFNRKPTVKPDRSDHKKPSLSRKPSDDSKSHNHHHTNGQNLVMEKVTILRRGQSLDSMIKSSESVQASEIIVAGTARIGPDPEMVPKQIRITDLRSPIIGKCDVYAGSAFAMSPAPESLPLPSFSKKKQVSVDDSATRDLRRLLRLDF